MPNNTRHALDSARKHGLDNLTEGMAATLDGWTSSLADLLGSLGAKLIDHLDRPKDKAGDFSKDKTGDKSKGKDAEKAEFCAVLASWEKLENDPAKKAALAEAAKQCRDRLRAEEKEKANDPEPQPARQGRDEGPTQSVERVIQVPEYIRDNPMYEQILAAQRESIAAEAKASTYQGIANQARIEAAEAREEKHEQQQRHEARQDPATPGIEKDDHDPYAEAARELDAKPLQEGQEIEGEVIEIAKAGGQNYYVIEQDGERVAVPAGDKPEHDKGDEITAERTKGGGFETGEAYDYGR